MMFIPVLGAVDILSLLRKYQLKDYVVHSFQIGNDNKIYLLLANEVPIFPAPKEYHYCAITILVDWRTGDFLHSSMVDFGMYRQALHYIQPHEDGFLLLGARAQLYADNIADQNALFLNAAGKIISRCCLGDGIQQCIVNKHNLLVTSYWDEGVFGNYGWHRPIGSPGLIIWSAKGTILWKNEKYPIYDCYALNLDADDCPWFYYYSDFNLVKINGQNDLVFNPKIAGSSGFLMNKTNTSFIFEAGYGSHCEFINKRLTGGSFDQGVSTVFSFHDSKMSPKKFHFRTSKALFLDGNNSLYFIDIDTIQL